MPSSKEQSLKESLLAAAALILLPITSQAVTPLYTVQVLGLVEQNYPASYFVPTAINDNGVVAGNAAVRVPRNTGLPIRGVLWQNMPGAYYTILGTLSEQQPTDSKGQITGTLQKTVGNNVEHRAYVLTPIADIAADPAARRQ